VPLTHLLRIATSAPEVTRAGFVEAAVAGDLLLFPTDTVYGLGARADREASLEALFSAKQRPADLPLPVLVGDREGLHRVVSAWPAAAEALAAAFWPGPLTLVLPRRPELPARLTAGAETVGVRMPDHPALLEWLRACDFALAVTSANLSGQPPAVTAVEIAPELLAVAALLLDGGPCPGGTASTVVDLSGPEPVVLRVGPITEARLRLCLAAR
jgi:L-threonylcarbamoyladenylate synthase